MHARAFPDEPEMHDRGQKVGESAYVFDSHSGWPHIVEFRQTADQWLSNYPADHANDLLSRFQSKQDDQYTAAVFELSLHERLLGVDGRIKIEGLIPDSGKAADFALHIDGLGSIDVEAFSPPSTMDQSSENLKLVNQYVGTEKSSDFSIWLVAVHGELVDTPRRRTVTKWARRVLNQQSWEEADRRVQGNPVRRLPAEPLILGDCRIDAELLVRPPEFRKPQSCLGMPAAPAGSFRDDRRHSVLVERITAKIKAKKRELTSTPFVLAVNIHSFTSFYESDERRILHGCRDVGLNGIWTFADGRERSEHLRCSAIWFFHRVDEDHPAGRRNALCLNPFVKHDGRMAVLAEVADITVGLPD